jgi:hypothetical protein
MDLQDFLDHVNRGALIEGGSEAHSFMHGAAQEALRIVAEINTGYRTPEEVRALLARLTGRTVDDSVEVFPPFYSEFGKNLTLGKGVFINIGCRFQDTGGITIGDGALIGHGSTITTLDHGMDPARRADMIPAPVRIGRQVWLGWRDTARELHRRQHDEPRSPRAATRAQPSRYPCHESSGRASLLRARAHSGHKRESGYEC